MSIKAKKDAQIERIYLTNIEDTEEIDKYQCINIKNSLGDTFNDIECEIDTKLDIKPGRYLVRVFVKGMGLAISM